MSYLHQSLERCDNTWPSGARLGTRLSPDYLQSLAALIAVCGRVHATHHLSDR